MAKYVLGIDLGTTYSCMAYVDETGRATVIKNYEGDYITPSVVSFRESNKISVGKTAKEEAIIYPESTVQLVKTLMGKSEVAISYEGKTYSPIEVSSYILKKLVEDASKELDTEIKDVVITVPAYFGSAEREATKIAGDVAGLNVLEILPEPVAAAMYYGYTREQDEKTILVFDLGGGTFDVTIINISSEKIEVVCADGSNELGGKDWDEAIAVAKEKGYDIDEILLVGGSTRMPQVKKALVDKYNIELKILEPDEAVARGAAIHAVNVYIKNQKNIAANFFKDTVLNSDDSVVDPNKDTVSNSDDLVVDPNKMSLRGRIKDVVFTTTKSFAIEVLVNNEVKCYNMIIKNQAMPNGSISVSNDFGTSVDNQENCELVVYETDFMEKYFEIDEDFVLGRAILELPENLPAGSLIEITFTLNTEGILEVRGVEKTTNRKVHATMQSKGFVSEEKINEFKEKSKQITLIH